MKFTRARKPKPAGDRKQGRKKMPNKGKQSGIAIVTVLSVLLLMSVLLLGFFSAASSELESSRYYASSLRTRQLTDVVTNMVVAQIRKATAQEKRAGTHFTWASQPGAITTFSNKGNTYQQLSIAKYKLYSSSDMEVDANQNLADDVASDWDQRPEQFVDLNAPIYSQRDGNLYFPIVDPRAHSSTNKTDPKNVEGFSYTNSTSTGKSVNGVQLPGSDPNSQRLPMPVQWLYILDDGTIGYLNASNNFVASSGTGTPSRRNPMVARIAFWTDDETSKINVNTASEGVHWDMPRYDSPGEREMALKQPAEREVSRFPGHPAMVSMSSVLFPHEDISKDVAKLQQIYEIAPKVQWGGSRAGTTTATGELVWDDDRLYATYDELLYRHLKGSGTSQRQEHKPFGDLITREKLEQSRFFFTANSIAPELTLWGTPKMTMWPTFNQTNRNTYFDDLIAFISTIGTSNRNYYWRRQNSTSRHWEIYVNNNGHNLSLLENYLESFIDPGNAIPGYGGSLGVKYGSGPYDDGKQILTQMWDYCRTSNLNDPYNPGNPYTRAPGQRGHGQVAGCCLCGGTGPHNTRWDKPFLKFPRGYGRLYTLTEATLAFKATAEHTLDGVRQGLAADQLQPGQVRVQVALLLETFCPSHGFTKMVANSNLQVVGDRFGNADKEPATITINGKPVGELTASRNKARSDTSHRKGYRGWGAHGGPRLFGATGPVYFKWPNGDLNINGQTYQYSQGYEHGIPVNADSGTMVVNVVGQPDRKSTSIPDMRVILYDERDNNSTGNLIQVFELDFPNTFTIPVPKYSDAATWNSVMTQSLNDPSKLVTEDMVTRSLVVSHGDFRLLGAKRVIENHTFQPHPKFNSQTENHAHSLVDADGYKHTGFSSARDMIKGANYSDELAPDFALDPDNDPNYFVDLNGNPRTDYKFPVDPSETGDFDTGVGPHIDGPYVNRGDDGNSPKGGANPYFDEAALGTNDLTSQIFFSPNRVVCGPGMFGSLSSGLQDGIPWRTLLFRPDPEHFGSADQPNVGDPPDHLWMDLFQMPVVEPYAISMPGATRGKINLNYQIVPFDNIKRATALHALMKAERVVAIPTNSGATYKKVGGGSDNWRQKINAYETMKQWEDRFEDNQLFRSPSEICEMYLVPEGQTLGTRSGRDYPSMRSYWASNKLTGDNVKERPYANMHARLTTKSNVYRVHMIVQTIKKARSAGDSQFDSEKDKITGQWRGSAIIERFIDPSDPDIPDYFDDPSFTQDSLEKFYNYRVLHVKQFTS